MVTGGPKLRATRRPEGHKGMHESPGVQDNKVPATCHHRWTIYPHALPFTKPMYSGRMMRVPLADQGEAGIEHLPIKTQTSHK